MEIQTMREAVAQVTEREVSPARAAIFRDAWDVVRKEIVPARPAVVEKRIVVEMSEVAAVAIAALLGRNAGLSPTSDVYWALKGVVGDIKPGTWTSYDGTYFPGLRYTPSAD